MPTFREHRNETANPRGLPAAAKAPAKRPMVARSAVFAAAKKLKSCVFWKDLNWIPGSQHSSTIRWQYWIQVVADGARRDNEKPFLRCALISWEWEFTCDTPLLRRMPLFTGALHGSGRIRSWRPDLPSYENHLSVTCPVHVDIIRKRLAVLSCSIRSESPSCMLATKGILASSAKRMFRYAVAHTCLHVMWFAQNGQGGKRP